MDSLAASNAGAFCSRVDHRSRRDAFEKRFGRRGLEEKKDIDSLIHITDDENDEDDEKLMHEVRVVQPLQQLPVQHLHGMAIHDELPRLNACLDESPSYQSLLEVLGRRPYMSPSSHGGEADEENFGNNESLPIPSRRCHLEQQHDSDNCPIRYYRIRYKGIANILSHPMVGAPRTGWYLGYGEVFFSRQILTSSCAVDNKPRARRRCLQTNGLSDEDGASCLIQDGTHEDIAYDVCINAAATASQIDTFIRIDGVLTGGYAMDSCNDPPLCAPADIDELDDSKTPRRSCTQQYTTGRSSLMNEHEYNDDVGQYRINDGTLTDQTRPQHVGYLLARQNNIVIVEELLTTPMSKSGKFMYRVVSTSPIQILAGPSFDAPKNKAVLLPGTIHEFSLKITLDTETEDLYFLRLSHRRGWIADRKLIQSSDHHRAHFVPVVKEISAETCIGGDSIASHSVGSSVAISSVSAVTLCSVAARMRHRPPRRQFVNGRDSITFPRHIVGGAIAKQSTPFTTLVKDRSKADKNRQDDALVMTPSSNVSMMSDDASINQELADQVMGPNLLSSNSVAPVKQSSHPPAQCRTFYLMRVTAPRGLKVLDAPQTQVNNLIYGKHHGGCLLTPLNAFSTLGDSKLSHQGRLGTAGASNNTNSAVFDSFLKTRIIRRGSYFEASRRMENTGGYDQGAGLIKLSDNSGWAIVPQFDELEAQYRLLSDAELSCADGHARTAFEEVGCAAVDDYFEIAKEYAPVQAASFKTLWVRVHARSGVQIACPPPIPPMSFEDNETASLSSHGSSVHRELKITQLCSKDTDVASSVGSSFIDAMFRTPTRKADRSVTQNQRAPPPRRPADSLTCSNVIACGLVLEVERPDEGAANQLETLYARLRGGQGWLPLSQAGKSVSTCVPPPEIRFGSFWFRVQAIGGIKVRLGPSKRAPSIKSGDGVYFRFECGEFLRASEVMTIFNEAGDPVECFAKLYRNRHVRLHKPVQRFRSLASLTVQAEWVNVFDEQELFLEECATEPRIERHKQGWRYTVLSSNGIAVRRGPRIAAAKTNVVLLQSETVAITERVRPAGERTSWLRLKDGRGWVQDVSDSGEQIMAPHTLRPRAVVQGGAPLKQKPTDKRQEIACNTIVARLFHNDGLEYKFHPNKE